MIDLVTLIKDWLNQQKLPLVPVDIYRFTPPQSTTDGTPIWANETDRIGAIFESHVRVFKAVDGSRLDITLQAADPDFFKKLMDAFIAVGLFN